MNTREHQRRSGERWRVLGVAATVIAVLTIVLSTRPTPLIASLPSPDGTHRVDLTGRADAPTVPLLTHEVYATVATRGVTTVTDSPVHIADHMDSTFRDAYGEPIWLANTVLLLPRSVAGKADHVGTLEVTNTSAQTLALLAIDAADLTLVIDLAPGARVECRFRLPRGEVTEYRLEGRWSNGVAVPVGRGVLRVTEASNAWALKVGDNGGGVEPLTPSSTAPRPD